jgi:hypothetical protein
MYLSDLQLDNVTFEHCVFDKDIATHNLIINGYVISTEYEYDKITPKKLY